MDNSAALRWRKPMECESSSCVETARDAECVYVRHSGHPDGPILAFTHEEWAAHVADIRAGHQD